MSIYTPKRAIKEIFATWEILADFIRNRVWKMSPACYHLASLIPFFSFFLISFSVQLMCSCISCQNETFLPEAVVHLCSSRAPGLTVLKGRNTTLGGLWTVPGCKFLTYENPAYLSHFQLSFPCSCLGLLQSLTVLQNTAQVML